MAKREISSTLRNLKFMQRAAQREENTKKEEEVKLVGNFSSPSIVNRKCLVIMEGDPHPGAINGRMSFQSFNPSIDKLNEAASNPVSATSSGSQSGGISLRENGSSMDRAGSSDTDKLSSEAEDLKRKQSEVVSETQYPKKTPKNVQGNVQSSPSSSSKGSFKKPKAKGEKLDWSVLRPSKSHKKRG